MSVTAYALINAFLATLVVAGIVGLLLWALVTQHRDPGCSEVRLRRRSGRRAVLRPELTRPQLERPAQEGVLG